MKPAKDFYVKHISAELIKQSFLIGYLTFLVILVPAKAFSVDPLFSQFYANPLYLNPAFAGADKCARMNLNYRNQPYPVFGTFATYSFSADRYFETLSGGLGINVIHDNQASLLSYTQAGITYAYHGKVSREWNINFGIQGSYMNFRLHHDNLIFPDQYNPGSGTITPGQETLPDNLNSHNIDFSSGLLVYNQNFYAGISAYHMSQPEIAFYSEDVLQIKYNFHMGYEFSSQKGGNRNLPTQRITYTPNFIFQSQAGFNRFNYGMYINMLPIITGIWFRHDLKHANSLIFMLGIKQEKYRIGYSYDYSLSGFSGVGGGAHEISVLRNFNCTRPITKYRIINCPTF